MERPALAKEQINEITRREPTTKRMIETLDEAVPVSERCIVGWCLWKTEENAGRYKYFPSFSGLNARKSNARVSTCASYCYRYEICFFNRTSGACKKYVAHFVQCPSIRGENLGSVSVQHGRVNML